MMRAAASPGPKPVYKNDEDESSMSVLLSMHKAGLFSRDEIRRMVFKKFDKVRHEPKPQANVRIASPSPTKPQANVRIARPSPTKPQAKARHASPSPTKPKAKARPNTKRVQADKGMRSMRDTVKNITRRRFFDECTDEDSILWFNTAGNEGSGKQTMQRLLFERASKDCINLLYDEYPGTLRNVKQVELKKAIHWQVMRDRNNWKGLTPKRRAYVGTKLTFDFVKEKQKIVDELACADDLTMDCDDCDVQNDGVKREAAYVKCEPNGGKDANKKHCFVCRVDVWTGQRTLCPASHWVTYPLESDWSTSVQQYCRRCWKKEEELLNTLAAQHRAVGPKKKKCAVAKGEPKNKRQRMTPAKPKRAKNKQQATPPKEPKGAKNKKQATPPEPKGAKNKKQATPPPKLWKVRDMFAFNKCCFTPTIYIYCRLGTGSMRNLVVNTMVLSLRKCIHRQSTTCTFRTTQPVPG